MSDQYIQLTSTINVVTIVVVALLAAAGLIAALVALALFAHKGRTRYVTVCLAASVVTTIATFALYTQVNPNAAVTNYIGEEPTGTVAVIETRDTALGTEATSFEITLDDYPNDPTVIVDDCEFDKMPELTEHIVFTYETSPQPFDGKQVHIELTNWWAAE